jgi:hypothetical protein
VLPWFARIACLVFFALFSGNWVARADDLADFNAAVEAASAHNRVAIGYLRTGNTDLASLEMDRLRDAWSRFTERFSDTRPDAFADNTLYGELFTIVSARLIGADIMLETGRIESARDSLNAIRGDLYNLRKASGIVVLADCVRNANAIMDGLMAYDDHALNWDNPETISGLGTKASGYGAELDRCDGISSDTVRKAPEFRRLVDGAKASLGLIPKAIATRDTDLVHRLLIELRSFDNLLAFRYD